MKKQSILTFATLLSIVSAQAQNNPAANPRAFGINAAASPIEVGQSTTTTFDLANGGTDPIPAGGASFNISFPPNVTVNQASLNLDGGQNIFTPTWFIDVDGATYLQLNVTGAGIPAATFMGPQTIFHMTVQITGTVAGGPALQQTINALPNPAIAQNANAGDDNAFGPIQVIPSTPLPVDLASFTARSAGDCQVLLRWTTGVERNCSHFEIESGTDGMAFAKAGSVPAKGSGSSYTYSYAQGVKGSNYFRLKLIDHDGSYTYSSIASDKLACTPVRKVRVYPTVSNGQVTVDGLLQGEQVSVYDMRGAIVLQSQTEGMATQLNLSRMTPGNYLVTIVTQAGERLHYKIVKQ